MRRNHLPFVVVLPSCALRSELLSKHLHFPGLGAVTAKALSIGYSSSPSVVPVTALRRLFRSSLPGVNFSQGHNLWVPEPTYHQPLSNLVTGKGCVWGSIFKLPRWPPPCSYTRAVLWSLSTLPTNVPGILFSCMQTTM